MAGEHLVQAARRFDREARQHKAAASRHRRLAQEAREQQAAIEAQCAALGIAVSYEPQPGEGHVHGQRQDAHP